MSRRIYNNEMKLSGDLYERALAHLELEISALKEQRHMSKEADKLYCQSVKALEQFKSTKKLGDALFCARLRG